MGAVMSLEIALSYVAQGWAPVPVPFRGKRPVSTIEDWPNLRVTEATAPDYFNGKPINVGVILGEASGELVDIDMDCSEAIDFAPRILWPTRTFGRPSKPLSHYLYKTDKAGRISQFRDVEKSTIVEYRANGGQTVFPGSTHESGEPITWTDNAPIATIDADDLRHRVAQIAAGVLLLRAGVSEDDAFEIVTAAEPPLARYLDGRALSLASDWLGCNVAPAPAQEASHADAGNVLERARLYVEKADPSIDGKGGSDQTLWVAIALVRYFLLPDSDSLTLLREYSQRCTPPWTEKELLHKIEAARTASRLKHPDGWLRDAPKTTDETTAKRPRADFNCTDLGNAERLVAQHGDGIRYCPPRRKWPVWDRSRWAWDETGTINRLAKKTVRSIYGEASKATDDALRAELVKHAQKSEASNRLSAMISLASTERGVAVMPDELDADPWLLNVANGTIDLRTGKLRPHNRKDLCTKISPVAYDPGARHPVWEAFLSDVSGDDDELEAFLRRVAGWALAGVCDEKKFVFLYGPPDTGKSTFLDALATVMGDYHVATDFTTWCVQTAGGGNRGDLVRLMGARLASSVEVRAGAQFDEALIKRVTGGDMITAAAKYESEVSFRPTFTLLLAANDAPKLRDDDAGAWARVLRVPFPNPVPASKKSPKVRRALTDPDVAGPAILAWAVRGCLEWQENGLGTCAAVEADTASYKREMDRIAVFLDTACVFEEGLRTGRKDFRDAYLAWCRENGVRSPLASKEVGARLRERGVSGGKSNGQRVWHGVALVDGES